MEGQLSPPPPRLIFFSPVVHFPSAVQTKLTADENCGKRFYGEKLYVHGKFLILKKIGKFLGIMGKFKFSGKIVIFLNSNGEVLAKGQLKIQKNGQGGFLVALFL